MSFPKYESYRDSGVEWLGEVPTRWASTPLKHLVRLRSGGTPTKERVEYWGGTIPWASAKDMKAERLVDTEDHITAYAVESGASELLAPGTVIVVVRGMILARIFPVSVAVASIAINQDLKALIPNGSILAEFLAWSLRASSIESLSRLDEAGHGTKALRMDAWTSMELPVPSLPEQCAIAAFLDRETAKIDALVEEQKRLIELLKEKRQAVISHAVTKGLDPNAPMKDSGIEWLGEVPAHWEVTGIKRYCTEITDGAHVSPETENGVYCFVSTKDLSESGIDFDECLRTSAASYEYLERNNCRPHRGDVLFSKDGTIGRTVVVPDDREFVVASSLIIIKPDKYILDPNFLHFLCQSKFVQSQVDGFVKGAGLPRLSIKNLTLVLGTFPPLEEQKKISAVLTRMSEKLGALRSQAESAMAILQERRSALISAAVTGKIDVRGAVSADAEAA